MPTGITIISFSYAMYLVEEYVVVVGTCLVLGDVRQDDVDGVDLVVDVGRPRQDEYAPEAAKDDEEPQK